MKRQKKLRIMLAVLAVLTGATLIATKLTEASKVVDPDADDVVIFSIAPEEVTSLSWTYGGETYTAVCSDGVWSSGEDAAVLLDGDYLDEMVAQLESVIAYRTIEAPGALADYGLREPQTTVCVNYLDDLTLFLGNETGIGGQYYCSIDDGRVYLVEESVMDVFRRSLTDILAPEETTGETTEETIGEATEESAE